MLTPSFPHSPLPPIIIPFVSKQTDSGAHAAKKGSKSKKKKTEAKDVVFDIDAPSIFDDPLSTLGK